PSATQNSVNGFQVDITQPATLGNTLATVAQTSNNSVGEKLTFSGSLFNNVPYSLTVPVGASQADLVTLINSDSKLKDLVKASIDGSGFLKIESKKYGAAGNFSVVSDQAAASDNSGIGTSGGTVTAGLDVAGTIDGKTATGSGQFLTGGTGTSVEGLQIQYKGSTTGLVGTVSYMRGVAAELNFSLNSFTDIATGLLTTNDQSIQSQIDDISQQMTDLQAQLDLRKQYLQQKFLAMETAVSALQSQQAQLSSMQASKSG
ncbi:MAG TPA: flagellar filament capping protein FliD, partial [Fimbriimonadaceae bacterium]|nr:flagellar filament capping protein FliD [Fimbriimonadaceae bacterium]